MKKRIFALLLTLALLSGLLYGCSTAPAASTPSAAPSAPAQSTAASTAEPTDATAATSFTDSAGRTVEVPSSITRVAPSGSMAQMFLMALAPEMMVSIPSKFPAEADPYIAKETRNLPVIGAFYGDENLSLEEIAAIAPDVIIDMGDTKEGIAADMDSIQSAISVPTLHINATTKTTGDAFRMLGKLLGKEAEAEKLAAYCEDTYAETEALMAQVQTKKTAMVLVGDAGLNVIPTGSFQAEMVNMVAENVAVVDNPTSKGSGNETDMEQLLAWDPEVILFATSAAYDTASTDATWQQLSAIKNKQFYLIPTAPYNWVGMPPSINRYLGLWWLQKLLYPEVATYDLYEKAAEYYDLFYHMELTKAQFDTLTAHAF